LVGFYIAEKNLLGVFKKNGSMYTEGFLRSLIKYLIDQEMKVNIKNFECTIDNEFIELKKCYVKPLGEGWAFLRYMTAINYLDVKMLDDKTEISYTSSVYSPNLDSRTKKILGPAGDLQLGQIVLVED
jgi:hypothetical protein